MSFFSNGFAVMVNNRRLKKAAKNKGKGDKGEGSGKPDKKDDEEGRWDMLTDAYGRQYWQHSVTGEWRYVYGGGVVSPVGAVNPSPLAYPGGVVFTPSPVYSVSPSAKKKEEGKKKEAKGRGWWETMYDDEGRRYWKHTVSEKKTYEDPYF